MEEATEILSEGMLNRGLPVEPTQSALQMLVEYLISFPIMMIGFLGVGIVLTWIVCYYWHLTRKVQSENRLKREMLERGMSGAEMNEVMKAGEPPWWKSFV